MNRDTPVLDHEGYFIRLAQRFGRSLTYEDRDDIASEARLAFIYAYLRADVDHNPVAYALRAARNAAWKHGMELRYRGVHVPSWKLKYVSRMHAHELEYVPDPPVFDPAPIEPTPNVWLLSAGPLMALSKRDEMIAAAVLRDGVAQNVVAAEHGISTSRICNVIRCARELIQNHEPARRAWEELSVE